MNDEPIYTFTKGVGWWPSTVQGARSTTRDGKVVFLELREPKPGECAARTECVASMDWWVSWVNGMSAHGLAISFSDFPYRNVSLPNWCVITFV